MQVGQLFENKISYGDEYGERVSEKINIMATKLLCGVPILIVSMASTHVSKASRIGGGGRGGNKKLIHRFLHK